MAGTRSTGCLKLEGGGPYYLRAIEHATANLLDSTIQITLYAAVDGADATLVKIETQMAFDTAEGLANALRKATGETADEATKPAN